MPPKEVGRSSLGLLEEKRDVVRGAPSPLRMPSICLPAGPEALQIRSGSNDVKWEMGIRGCLQRSDRRSPRHPGNSPRPTFNEVHFSVE